MSSPSSRLKRVKRSPLPGSHRVPFREIWPPSQPSPPSLPPPSDNDLLSSMTSRLARAEAQLQTAQKELKEKDEKIRELEKRLSSLSPSFPLTNHQLQKKCDALQKQVMEMEKFLNDYGMIWIGSDGDKGREEKVWPADLSVSHKFSVNYDQIVKNVESLNMLSDESSVSAVSNGATLTRIKPIPLILYANGIVLFRGPFRPFSDPSTQQCVQDLMDGYFPSELQSQFPNGVTFSLNDHRDKTFIPTGPLFSGDGHRLGGERGPSKLSTTSQLPGPKLSTRQFLARLPASVIKRGRVLNVRSEVSDCLSGSTSSSSSSSSFTILTTSNHKGKSVTTLKVRSVLGDQTVILKMRPEETIRDVWSHILTQTPPTITSSSGYHLVSGVNHKVYSDLSATLSECELVPSATLYITRTIT